MDLNQRINNVESETAIWTSCNRLIGQGQEGQSRKKKSDQQNTIKDSPAKEIGLSWDDIFKTCMDIPVHEESLDDFNTTITAKELMENHRRKLNQTSTGDDEDELTTESDDEDTSSFTSSTAGIGSNQVFNSGWTFPNFGDLPFSVPSFAFEGGSKNKMDRVMPSTFGFDVPLSTCFGNEALDLSLFGRGKMDNKSLFNSATTPKCDDRSFSVPRFRSERTSQKKQKPEIEALKTFVGSDKGQGQGVAYQSPFDDNVSKPFSTETHEKTFQVTEKEPMVDQKMDVNKKIDNTESERPIWTSRNRLLGQGQEGQSWKEKLSQQNTLRDKSAIFKTAYGWGQNVTNYMPVPEVSLGDSNTSRSDFVNDEIQKARSIARAELLENIEYKLPINTDHLSTDSEDEVYVMSSSTAGEGELGNGIGSNFLNLGTAFPNLDDLPFPLRSLLLGSEHGNENKQDGTKSSRYEGYDGPLITGPVKRGHESIFTSVKPKPPTCDDRPFSVPQFRSEPERSSQNKQKPEIPSSALKAFVDSFFDKYDEPEKLVGVDKGPGQEVAYKSPTEDNVLKSNSTEIHEEKSIFQSTSDEFKCKLCPHISINPSKLEAHQLLNHTLAQLKDILPFGSTQRDISLTLDAYIEDCQRMSNVAGFTGNYHCVYCKPVFSELIIDDLKLHFINDHKDQLKILLQKRREFNGTASGWLSDVVNGNGEGQMFGLGW